MRLDPFLLLRSRSATARIIADLPTLGMPTTMTREPALLNLALFASSSSHSITGETSELAERNIVEVRVLPLWLPPVPSPAASLSLSISRASRCSETAASDRSSLL